MSRYVIMFEYDSKKFMDIDKIITFKKNLKRVKKQKNNVNISFYGEASNEEMATFMSYFNSLLQENICNISISFKTKEIVIEKGINNKSIKLSAQKAKEVKNKKFDSIIKEYYNDEDIQIKVFPTKNWESIILDFIGE